MPMGNWVPDMSYGPLIGAAAANGKPAPTSSCIRWAMAIAGVPPLGVSAHEVLAVETDTQLVLKS